jgi:hypothetical protein
MRTTSHPSLWIFLSAATLTACSASSGHLNDAAPPPTATRTVDLAPTLTSALAPVVEQSSVDLTFDVDLSTPAAAGLDLAGFGCRFEEDVAFRDCSAQPFTVSSLEDAKRYALHVRANLADKQSGEALLSNELVISFAVDLPGGAALDPAQIPGATTGTGGSSRVSVLASTLQLGLRYAIQLAPGVHVTEYWNEFGYSGSAYFRILPESDPTYVGKTANGCADGGQTTVDAVNAGGRWYQYCKTVTADSDVNYYNATADGYIELATDPEDVADTNHERFYFATFPAPNDGAGASSLYVTDSHGYQLTLPSGLQKFYQVCRGKPIDFVDVPMVNNFFLGRAAETVRFWYCDTILPAADGTPTLWKVGAFQEIDQADAYCSACDAQTTGIEAVYMTRPSNLIMMPSYFARKAQERIGGQLQKVTP